MTKKIIAALSLTALMAISVQCASSHAKETYSVSTGASSASPMAEKNFKLNKSYDEISVATGIKVFYTVGNKKTARVTGPQSEIDRISITIDNGKLRLITKEDRFGSRKGSREVSVYINGPQFAEVDLSSGGTINMESAIDLAGRELEIDISSGGIFNSEYPVTCSEISIEGSSGGIINIRELNAKREVEVDASSGSIINISGRTAKLEVDASSGAIVTVNGMKAASGYIDASSGAIINCGSQNLSISKSSGAIVKRN